MYVCMVFFVHLFNSGTEEKEYDKKLVQYYSLVRPFHY